MRKLLLGLMIANGLYAQQDAVSFTAANPTAVFNASISHTGTTGTTTYYYFIVAQYPVGGALSQPFPTFDSNGTLSGGNFNTIFWQPQPRATSYDILRSTTPGISLPCAACLVASGNTGTSQTDTSNTVTAYNTTLVGSVQMALQFNNRDYPTPRLETLQFPFWQPTGGVTFAQLGTPPRDGAVLYCSDCIRAAVCSGGGTGAIAERIAGSWSCQDGSGSTGTPAGANLSTQINNAGAFGAVPIGSALQFYQVNAAANGYQFTSAVQTFNVSIQAGADFGAKAIACLATGAKTCDATNITGAQTATATIAVGANQTLKLPCATLTTTAAPAFTVNVGSQIIGCGSGGGTSNTVPSRVNLSTSGASGIAPYCLGVPCATATKPDNVLVQGVMLSQANANTGIGVDFTATGQSNFVDLMINNFHDAVFNSIGCQGGAGFPSCNYNTWISIHGNLPNGGNGFHFSKSSNAQHIYSANFIGGLNQYLFEDPSNNTNIPDEIDCYGCIVESLQSPLSAPAAPTLGDSGGGGAASAFAKVSCVTAAGETLPSSEASIVGTLTGNTLTIAAPTCAAGSLGWRPYASATTGTEKNQVAAGNCAAITVNGLSVCPLGTGWSQTGAFSATTGVPSAINSSGAGIAVQLGLGITFYGGRCEPGNANTVCAQTFPSNTATLVIDGMFFQYASASSVTLQDQSGLIIMKDTGTTYKSYKSGIDTSVGPNLIPNYSFESWNGTTLPNGWSSVNGTNFDTTGFTTQDTTNVNSGTFNAKLGNTNNLNRGIAITNAIPIDQSRPYTLAVSWASADTTVRLIIGYRLYDNTGTLINDQTARVFGLGNIGNAGAGSTLSAAFASACNCFQTGAITPSAINTLQQLFHMVKFPVGTAAVRIAFYTGNAAPAGSTTLWVDDVFFAQGSALQSPTSSATQCAYGATVNKPCEPLYAAALRDSGSNGITTAHSWLASDGGAALAIAGNVIAPTANFHEVGAGLIKTITVPFGLPAGACFSVGPTAAFTYDATGNILVPGGGGTATVDRIMDFCWNGTKWRPSY